MLCCKQPSKSNSSPFQAKTAFFLQKSQSSIYVSIKLLANVGKCRYLHSADLTLGNLLLFDHIRIDISLLRCRSILNISWQLNAFMVITLIAILCYLSICLRI